MNHIRIAIADDHKLYAEAVKLLLSAVKSLSIKVCATLHSGNELLDFLDSTRVDLVLLDLNMPDGSGLEVLPEIKLRHPAVKVLVVTMYDAAKFIKSVLNDYGADGYFLKTSASRELIEAISEVMHGELYISQGLKIFPRNGEQVAGETFEDQFQLRHRLTPREIQILLLISRAKSNKQIADELFISDQTVMVHRKNIMRKLSVSNTAGLIKFALDHDLS